MTDLVDLLRRNGETLKRSGSEYQWGEGSNKVTIRGNTWYHQYDQRGGDAIDFVQRFYRKSFPDAVQYLLSQNGITITPAQQQQRQTKEEKVFTLPPRNDNMRRVYAYLLHHRKLDRDVVNAFAHHNLIYESADTHNVTETVSPVTHKNAAPHPRAATKAMSPPARWNTHSIGTAAVSMCFSLKHPLICCLLSL